MFNFVPGGVRMNRKGLVSLAGVLAGVVILAAIIFPAEVQGWLRLAWGACG
jgi:hypothetical protein